MRTGHRDAEERGSKASDKQRSGNAYPERPWLKMNLGGLQAKVGDYIELLIVPTRIKLIKPFKGSQSATKPIHLLELFIPGKETIPENCLGKEYNGMGDQTFPAGSEFVLVVDSRLNKRGKLRMDFAGGLLHNFGRKMTDAELMELADFDATSYDVDECGGGFVLDDEFFGEPVVMGREAIQVENPDTGKKSTLQTFYWDEPTDDDLEEINGWEQYMERYDADGSYTDEFMKEWAAEHGGKANDDKDEMFEEAVELAIEIMESGANRFATMKEIEVIYGISHSRIREIIDAARAKMDESKGADEPEPEKPTHGSRRKSRQVAEPEPEPEEEKPRRRGKGAGRKAERAPEPEPEEEEVDYDKFVPVASGMLKNGMRKIDVIKELIEMYDIPRAEAQALVRIAAEKTKDAPKAKPSAKSDAAKKRVSDKKLEPAPEPVQEDEPVDDEPVDEDDDDADPVFDEAVEMLVEGKSKADVIKSLMSDYEMNEKDATEIVDEALDAMDNVDSVNEAVSEPEAGKWEPEVFADIGDDVKAVLMEEWNNGNTAKGTISKRVRSSCDMSARETAKIVAAFVDQMKAKYD